MPDATVPEPILAAEGEVPLPPPEMFEQLDNSEPATTDPEPRPAVARTKAEVAVLEFVGAEKPWREIPLRFPFRWEGRVVDTLLVKRLSVEQIRDYIDSLRDDEAVDRHDVYGLMCGLPGKVIRALPDPDGDHVCEVCFDFLPHMLGGKPG